MHGSETIEGPELGVACMAWFNLDLVGNGGGGPEFTLMCMMLIYRRDYSSNVYAAGPEKIIRNLGQHPEKY